VPSLELDVEVVVPDVGTITRLVVVCCTVAVVITVVAGAVVPSVVVASSVVVAVVVSAPRPPAAIAPARAPAAKRTARPETFIALDTRTRFRAAGWAALTRNRWVHSGVAASPKLLAVPRLGTPTAMSEHKNVARRPEGCNRRRGVNLLDDFRASRPDDQQVRLELADQLLEHIPRVAVPLDDPEVQPETGFVCFELLHPQRRSCGRLRRTRFVLIRARHSDRHGIADRNHVRQRD
jgi:hypothetical protein